MVPEPNRVEPPRDVYVNLARRSDQLWQRGRMLGREVKVFVINQYNLLKRHDKELFPLALIAASICMLFASNVLLLITSFAAGALFRVAKGEAWKEGIVHVAKEAWQGSNLGKIACVAFLILVVAPMKWGVAAFGLGIYVVHVLQQRQPDTVQQLPPPQPEIQQPVQPALLQPAPLVVQQPVQGAALIPQQQQVPQIPPQMMAAFMQFLQQFQAANP